MLQAQTKYFSTVDYEPEAVLTFPAGLPAFDRLVHFLLIEHPSSSPLVFLQSLDEVAVCLPAIPVLAVDPDYELSLSVDDLETLGFAASDEMPAGNSIGCFAIVLVPATGPATANLLAPVVVNLTSKRAVQAVRSDTRYSHQCPVVPSQEEVVCS